MRGTPDSRGTFAGAGYVPSLDRTRLSLQIERIRSYMLGVEWRALREIKAALEHLHAPAIFPESSISSQLRNLRRAPYFYTLVKRRRAGVRAGAGIWQYRLLAPGPRPQLGLFREKQDEPPAAAARVDAGSDADSEPDDDGGGREEFFREARRIASEASK